MQLSKEVLDIVYILGPGFISFIIIEALIPHKKAEFKRVISYVIALSVFNFMMSAGIWVTVYEVLKSLNIGFTISKIFYSGTVFSFHNNVNYAVLVYIISVVSGFLFAYYVHTNFIYRIMDKFYKFNMASDLEVWDDFLRKERKDSYIVVRDIKNNLMYYGQLEHFSIANRSKEMALNLLDVDVFINDKSKKLYNVKELYLPFREDSMTIEFPNFEFKEGEKNE